MSDKQQMDDFATLFLPDLLNRLDSLQEPAKHGASGSRASALQHHGSPEGSTSSSGMSLLRFLEAPQPAAAGDTDQNYYPSAFSEMNQYLESPSQKATGHVTASAPAPDAASLRSAPAGISASAGISAHVTSPLSSYLSGSNMAPAAFARNGSGYVSYGGRHESAEYDAGHKRAGLNTHSAGDRPGSAGHVTPHQNLQANNAFPTDSTTNASGGISHCLSPFSSLDMGHMSHYADLLTSDPAPTQNQRSRQFQMGHYQQTFAPSHVQYDSSLWNTGGDSNVFNKSWVTPQPGLYYPGCGPTSVDSYATEIYNGAWPASRGAKDFVETRSEADSGSRSKSGKSSRSVRSKQPVGCSTAPPISVDYSDVSLDQLVDLKKLSPESKKPVVSSGSGQVNFLLRGFLNGRLLSNDQDNYNYIYLSSGAVDQNQMYQPQVISCYRRNFINLHLHLSIDSPTSTMTIEGEQILRLRVEVSAITDKEDPEPVALLNNEHDVDNKDPRKSTESSQIELIGPTHVVEIADCKQESFWKVKKLQFKSATANSTNLVFQTYYRFLIRVYAETSSCTHVIEELASNPIIVRGRNPSFYHSKHDILIKAKSPGATASYDYSALAVPLLAHDLAGQESRTSSNIPSAETVPSTSLGTSTDSASKHELPSPALKTKEENADSEIISKKSEPVSSEEENDDGKHELKQAEDSRSMQAPGGTDLRKILESLSQKKSGKYLYFPISNVYYLPPINVVYFPHAAHHTESVNTGIEQPSTESKIANAPEGRMGSERKTSSKVYFR